ncbi:ribonuclease P protein subunit p30 [Ceratobasidium sp. AG-Ba]|nr:ribonuclease P protein subunit p30 [Ceratobasidium sp. AG-Ba]QRW12659.1 ribonuclease P protein subunit p30 [Ceratobasidium sp. AG-Ba]
MSVATGSRDARVHTQPSNRANAALAKGKSKESSERRVVYKPVLENPHQVKWPSTPLNVQNSILACLADLLPEVAEYHIARETASRKRKSGVWRAKRQAKELISKAAGKPTDSSQPSKKRAREGDDNMDIKRAKLSHDTTPEEKATASPPGPNDPTNEGHGSAILPMSPTPATAIIAPKVLKHCTFESHPTPKPRLRAVLVCRSDVDPPLLIAHFPILVATCNSSLPGDSSDDKFVKLVTLPMRAEHSLAEVTGLRRVAVMALDVETPGIERLESLLSDVPVLRETWLAPPSNAIQEPKLLVPTHVKQLKTTAPKDMKAAKEKRKRGIEEAKEKAKESEGRQKKRRKLGSKADSDTTAVEKAAA